MSAGGRTRGRASPNSGMCESFPSFDFALILQIVSSALAEQLAFHCLLRSCLHMPSILLFPRHTAQFILCTLRNLF